MTKRIGALLEGVIPVSLVAALAGFGSGEWVEIVLAVLLALALLVVQGSYYNAARRDRDDEIVAQARHKEASELARQITRLEQDLHWARHQYEGELQRHHTTVAAFQLERAALFREITTLKREGFNPPAQEITTGAIATPAPQEDPLADLPIEVRTAIQEMPINLRGRSLEVLLGQVKRQLEDPDRTPVDVAAWIKNGRSRRELLR